MKSTSHQEPSRAASSRKESRSANNDLMKFIKRNPTSGGDRRVQAQVRTPDSLDCRGSWNQHYVARRSRLGVRMPAIAFAPTPIAPGRGLRRPRGSVLPYRSKRAEALALRVPEGPVWPGAKPAERSDTADLNKDMVLAQCRGLAMRVQTELAIVRKLPPCLHMARRRDPCGSGHQLK